MTADIVAATLAGLGPMIQSGSRRPLDRFAGRRQYGDALLAQGSKFAPLRGGVAEGLARAGQAVLGGWMAGKADEEQLAEEDKQRKGIMEAIAQAQTSGDFSAVAKALAGAGQLGPAASLMFADMASRRQQQQGGARVDAILGPPGTGAPAGPPTAAAPGEGAPQTGGVFDVPEQYAPLVAAAAKKYGVDPRLLASTGWNESRWQPNAVAIGDQPTINPATGRRYDGRGLMGWGDNIAAARGFNAADPAASIEHAAAVYREFTDKYGGNVLLARLAYGWGPGNVDKWLQAGGDPNKVPDGAKVWLPRTAFGIADEQQARAAFPQIAPMLKPGVQFNYGGQGQVAQGGPPPPARVAGPPMAPPVANPPQAAGPIPMQMPAPQMAAAPPQGGSAPPDDSGEGPVNPGFGPPQISRVPMPAGDAGAAWDAMARRLQSAGFPDDAKQVAMLAAKARQEQTIKQEDRWGKSAPDTVVTPDGSVAIPQGGLEAQRALAMARTQGGGQYVPATQNGAVGQRNTVTDKFDAGPAGDKLREVDQGAREALAVTARYLDVFKDRDAIAAYLNNPQSPNAQRVNQAFENLKIIMRSPALLNTGVLQPAEARMIEETLLSPTSIRGLIASPDAMGAKIDELQRLIRTRHAAAFQSAGVAAPDIGAPQPQAGGQGAPPPNHVEALRANPALRDQFDAKYGPGAADRALGGR